jgi:hypothetical protein
MDASRIRRVARRVMVGSDDAAVYTERTGSELPRKVSRKT